ncbi:MAG: hypothetical protein GY927_24470, partial [bacterium]|nr:hypothetical protein [bacterium]
MLARPKNKKKKEYKAPRPITADLRAKLAICASYPQDVMFLDIETTGLSHYYDEITVVGWSIDGKSKTFVKGGDHTELLEDAANAKALV